MFDKVKSEMKAKGWSTYKLSRMTGIPSNILYHYMKYGPMFPMYRHKISDALGVPEKDLFTPTERGERNGKRYQLDGDAND